MRHTHTSPRVPQSASIQRCNEDVTDGACASHVSRPEVRETHGSGARESSNTETTALLILTRHLQCARIQHGHIHIMSHLFLRPYVSRRLASRGVGEARTRTGYIAYSGKSGTPQSCGRNCLLVRLRLSFSLVRTSRGGMAAPRIALDHPCYPSLPHMPHTLLTDTPESSMSDRHPDRQPDELTSYVKLLVDTQTRGETAEPLPHLQMPWPRTSPRYQSCSQESRKRSVRSRAAEMSGKGRKSRPTMSREASLNRSTETQSETYAALGRERLTRRQDVSGTTMEHQ
jgi:hypothetical protein